MFNQNLDFTKAGFFMSERLQPEKFLRLSVLEKLNISQTRLILPSILDDDDFGSVEVIYKMPVFRMK